MIKAPDAESQAAERMEARLLRPEGMEKPPRISSLLQLIRTISPVMNYA